MSAIKNKTQKGLKKRPFNNDTIDSKKRCYAGT
jgi:hypothetical protein